LQETYLALLENNVMMLGAAGAAYHRRITEAIELRNPVAARTAMLEHLNNTILQMQDQPEGTV
jgi:DNA-binding FadR family transcriptional regulator